jgi:hypothetical protein
MLGDQSLVRIAAGEAGVALANMAARKPSGWMGDGVGEQRLSGDSSWRRRVAGAEAAPSSREGADAGVTGAEFTLGENGDDGRTEVGDDAPGGDDGGVRAASELRLLDPGAALRDGLLPRDGPGERGPAVTTVLPNSGSPCTSSGKPEEASTLPLRQSVGGTAKEPTGMSALSMVAAARRRPSPRVSREPLSAPRPSRPPLVSSLNAPAGRGCAPGHASPGSPDHRSFRDGLCHRRYRGAAPAWWRGARACREALSRRR